MGNFLSANPLVLLIAACELGFWVLLVLGLAARYLLRARVLSTVLLLLVPVLDLVLVSASIIDVAGGSAPGLTHGLAAVYLGFTVAFGHSMIRWADRRFAHRFAGGPPPPAPPKYGPERVAHEWREWGKAALATVIALAVIAVTALVAGTAVPAPLDWFGDPMWNWGGRLAAIALIWFVGWPLRVSIAPPRRPATTHR
ncbi:hypothetical protein [Pseudonocardia sp. GCM10023141]|uniref:hypothetical protein n=1 Tax=Pseudonocardia sp. GCM10023141 TaxID=3252653 RepID=UPI003609F155